MKVLIVAGISGAGKTLALKFLQDFGYFCIDNLPVEFMEDFFKRKGQTLKKCAIGIDIRERKYFPQFLKILKKNKPMCVVFLDCSSDVLVRRFVENRRRPPLAGKKDSILSAISKERKLLAEIKAIADILIDTSGLTPWELKSVLAKKLKIAVEKFHIEIVSFGFKWGLPQEVDFVFDVRFLPNPNYEKNLRKLTGFSKKVREFVIKNSTYKKFLSTTEALLKEVLKKYPQSGKNFLTIGCGCTGGRHRSVVFAEDLSSLLRKEGFFVSVNHRDIKK
ncbi:MAG: RNase adapter RapZ [Elusimicrobia bacterium]|nr:RNase adapter RapZ [Elusimicrobiota bacterium]